MLARGGGTEDCGTATCGQMQASGPTLKTGGERPHKRGSKFDPFRTTTGKSPHIRLPSVAPVSFFRIPGARMSLFRVAALLIMCGIALSTLQFAEGNFLGLAEAMPEDKYSYVPTVGNFDGVRSFGEQVKHVACAQFAFFNEFEGKKPPEDCEKGGHDPAKTKAELIKYLKDSFDYSNRVLGTLTANNALDRVEGRYAGPNTKLGISVISVSHITDHYGQLVEYLRLNGIVPPFTQKYGLKVR